MVRAANGLEKSIIAAERIKEYSDVQPQVYQPWHYSNCEGLTYDQLSW